MSPDLGPWSIVNYSNGIPVCTEKSGNCTRLLESHSLWKYAGRHSTLFISVNYLLLSSNMQNFTDRRVLAHSEVDIWNWSLATYEELGNHFHTKNLQTTFIACVEQQIFSRLDAPVYQEEEDVFNKNDIYILNGSMQYWKFNYMLC